MAHKATNQMTTIRIDIGKNNFHLIDLDAERNIVLRRKLSRSHLVVRLAKEVGHWLLTTLRDKLVKINAKVVSHVECTPWGGQLSVGQGGGAERLVSENAKPDR